MRLLVRTKIEPMFAGKRFSGPSVQTQPGVVGGLAPNRYAAKPSDSTTVKSLLSILAIVILNVNIGNAQLLSSLGAKIAYTSADQKFDYKFTSIDRQRRSGFNAGIFAEWFDGEPFSLITQLEYAQRGMGMKLIVTSESDPEGGTPTVFENRVDYLSVPILAKVYIFKQSLRPYLLGGIRADFLLKYVSDRGLFDPTYAKFAKSIYGLTFGVGTELASLPVLIEARYNFDLKKSYKTEFLTVSNNSVDIWLGIAFSTLP